MKNAVELTPEAQKKLKKLPKQVLIQLRTWVGEVELLGIGRVKKIKGYHDEPLKGKRKG